MDNIVYTNITIRDGWEDDYVQWEFEIYGGPCANAPHISIPLFTCEEDSFGNVFYYKPKNLFNKIWSAYWTVKYER